MPERTRVSSAQTQEFFQKRGWVYLQRTRIAAPQVLSYNWGQSPYYLANQEEFERLTARYGKAIRECRLAPLELQSVGDEVGWGVFASQPLEEGDFVGEYTGVLQELTDAPAHVTQDGHYLSDYSWNYPDELPDGTEFEINAFSEGNLLRFVNHSGRANCAVDHTLVDGVFVTFFRVTSSIDTGGQLLVDYGDAYWSGGYRTLVDL